MRRVLGTPLAEYLPALGLLLLTAAYLAIASTYRPQARAFPAAVASIMLVLLVLDLASRTRTRIGTTLLRWLNPGALAPAQVPQRPAASPGSEVAAALWMLGFAAALVLLGILTAVPIYVYMAMRLRARRSFLVSAAIALGVSLFVWLLFAVLLRIDLYPGVLFART